MVIPPFLTGKLGEDRVFSRMDAAAKEVLSVSNEMSSACKVELGTALLNPRNRVKKQMVSTILPERGG